MVTVYVDVLIGLNWFVNYFLLLGVSKIGRTPLKFVRNLLSSFVLALGALSIFLPALSAVWEVVLRFSIACVGILIAFGYRSITVFLKNVGMLFTATFAYGGIMLGLWYIFHPKNLVIHNGVSYFNLSPVTLIVFTLIAYGVLWLFRKNFAKESKLNPYVTLHICNSEKTITIQAKVDTGFTLRDVYTDHPVILISPSVSKKLWKSPPEEYRLLPYETVNGEGLLHAVTLEGVSAHYDQMKVSFDLVVMALGEKEFHQSFDALVGYDFIERMTDTYETSTKSMDKTTWAVCKEKNRLYQRFSNLTTPLKAGGRTTVDGTTEKR